MPLFRGWVGLKGLWGVLQWGFLRIYYWITIQHLKKGPSVKVMTSCYQENGYFLILGKGLKKNANG